MVFWKKTIKYFIGFVICKMLPLRSYKRYLLSTWRQPENRRFIDKIFYGCCFAWWIKFEFLKEKDPEKREEMKSICMGGEAGVGWAQNYQSRQLDFNKNIGNLTYRDAYPIFDKLGTLLKDSKEKCTVIQIGSSSGREIAHIAKNNPEHDFIGTDIYSEIVKYSSDYHKHSNLSFVQCSAQKISELLKSLRRDDLIIFSSGSVQYVLPEYVDIFLSACSKYSVRILLLEPISFKECNPEKIAGSRWRGEFSYTHNFRYYAEKNNFQTVESRIIKPYSQNDGAHAFTGHYYYHGISMTPLDRKPYIEMFDCTNILGNFLL